MAEIAGLVVGGIPLAIWALEKYAEPLGAFNKYRMSIETFRTDLILQKRQLQTTLSNVGLPDNPSKEELQQCFELKFPDISRELMSIIGRMDDANAALLKTLEVDINGKPEALPEKAQWEWRRVKHSFNLKRRSKVIEDLRHWNDDLRRSLEKSEVPAQDDSHQFQALKLRFTIARSNAIRQCLASFHRALELGFRCSCSIPHQAAIDLDWETYEHDSAKSFKVSVFYVTYSQDQWRGSWCKLGIISETLAETAGPAPRLLTPLPAADVRSPSPNSSFRSKVAYFKLKRSLSRTLPSTSLPAATTASSPNPENLQASPAVPTKSNDEITSLCAALCTESNPWPLKRFLKDPDENQTRHYSLYHNPVDSPDIIKTVPLKSLFLSREQRIQAQNPYLALSAKQRFGIAATTAWSVLHLSCSPWLDEHWDKKQMSLFVEKARSGREIFSRHPCASCVSPPLTGQDEAAPSDKFKEFIPNRTVFALGILLIELCISEPVADLEVPTSLVDTYKYALDKLDQVYLIAGDSYADATARCVKFSFEGRDMYNDFDFEEFRQKFYDVVVAPVQATYLMYPDSHHSL